MLDIGRRDAAPEFARVSCSEDKPKAQGLSACSPEDSVCEFVQEGQGRGTPADARRQQERLADAIIGRYAMLSAIFGGVTALPGSFPGIGTALAMLGSGLTDAAVSTKIQIDMCMSLAECFDYDLKAHDAKQLAFAVAANAAVERASVEAVRKLATRAGGDAVRRYLKSTARQAVHHVFKRVGIGFVCKVFERSLPLGIGVVIGSGADYALTRYVGKQAKEWFLLNAGPVTTPHDGERRALTRFHLDLWPIPLPLPAPANP
jgi:hypothetical protein